jgi:peptide/nickel transport system substrate-binding protein
MPAPYGPGLGLLDALPILPRHKLEAAFKAGTFRDAWGLSTPPADLAGLGPFVLKTYAPGERMIFARNPHYWRLDEKGAALPRLDEIELQIVPEQNAELLRLQGGTTDLMTAQVRPEDLAGLRRLETTGAVQLVQAGVSISPDGLWFNLTPGANKDRPWLQSEELRRAISYAVDRQAFADTVFLGAAKPIYGPITPGNPEWFAPDLPKTEHDVARAKALLGSIGLTDRNGDGTLEDQAGHQAHFSMLTQKGHSILEHSVAVLREQLGKVGLVVDVVALEQPALLDAFFKGQYEAMYFYGIADSFDPARNLDFWLSSGDFHFWQPGQKKPARAWEATIDDLMQRESTTMDRAEARRLFNEAQKALADHLPIIYFAAPDVTIAMSSRVHGATPSVLQPPVLWNADVLWVTAAGRAGRQ